MSKPSCFGKKLGCEACDNGCPDSDACYAVKAGNCETCSHWDDNLVKGMCSECTEKYIKHDQSLEVPYSDDSIHLWFGLSYAQYLTIPRSVLQSMPSEWQKRFVQCLNEIDDAIDWMPEKGTYYVQLRETAEDLEMGPVLNDPMMDYQHGRRRIPLK